MNLREIAKKLDLSTATVSIALLGNPAKSKLNPQTVARVHRLILFISMVILLVGCLGMKPVTPEEVITIGTYNVRCPSDKTPELHWKTRIPLIREVIRRTGMEIIGLQEPMGFQLQAILADSDFKSVGGARDDFRNRGEFSCIIYNSKRFELLDSGTFSLSENPNVPGVKSWGSAYPRIASWGLFRDQHTGKKFLFYNTHLDNKSELAQINGIKLIVEHARENKYSLLPMILSGDFNALPDSETIRTVCSLLSDSMTLSETSHQGETGSFHKWGTCSPRRRIDYIFVSSQIRVLQHWTEDCRVKGMYSSDHDPVCAKIVL